MKILVFGAGSYGERCMVPGCTGAGHHVTVLARAPRRADIQRHGLVLEDIETGARSVARVAVAGQLLAEDSYDMVLVAVRRDQLSAILPDLALNRSMPAVLFMLNNPSGSSAPIEALGPQRVILGFPGAGGSLEGYVVYYRMISQQPTPTIGEPDVVRKLPVYKLCCKPCVLVSFEFGIDNDMDAWLTSHAFFVTSVSGAIYLAGGDCLRLSRSPPPPQADGRWGAPKIQRGARSWAACSSLGAQRAFHLASAPVRGLLLAPVFLTTHGRICFCSACSSRLSRDADARHGMPPSFGKSGAPAPSRCTAFTAQSTIMRRLRSKILQQPSCSDPFQAGLSSGWRSFRGFAAKIARMQQLQTSGAVPAPLVFLRMRSRHLRVVGNPALRYGAHSIDLHGKSKQAAAKSEAPRRKSL